MNFLLSITPWPILSALLWIVLIVAALLLLMLTGMPLGVVTLVVSIGTALRYFGPRGLFRVASNVYGLLENYPLVAVPLFVFMASILERAGVAEDLFDAMSIFAGNLRGGVALQTTVVAVILAAMSGVMGGEIVMLGLVALPQLLRLKYDRRLSIGLICAAGALATRWLPASPSAASNSTWSSATSTAPSSIRRSAKSDLPLPEGPRKRIPLPSMATQLA